MRLQSGCAIHAGFTLVEVLVALFVVTLGIAGAAGLQMLAVRAARDAAHLADGTRLASSLGERVRANLVVVARPDAANPYLQFDYDAGSGAPAAAALCYADTACGPDDLARFDLFDVSTALAASLPGGRIRVCRDAALPDSMGLPAWDCDGQAGAPVVVKIGWRAQGDAATGAPKVMLPLSGAGP